MANSELWLTLECDAVGLLLEMMLEVTLMLIRTRVWIDQSQLMDATDHCEIISMLFFIFLIPHMPCMCPKPDTSQDHACCDCINIWCEHAETDIFWVIYHV